MWNVSIDQAVEMYARFFQSRYGMGAVGAAEEKLIQLRECGDADGADVWTKVKRLLEQYN